VEGGHRGDMRVKAGTGAMRTGWESSGKHEMETSALGLVNLHYRWQAQSTLPRPIFNRSQIYRFVGCPRPHVGYPKWNHCPCQFPRTRSGSIRRLSDSGVRSCLASVLAATSICLSHVFNTHSLATKDRRSHRLIPCISSGCKLGRCLEIGRAGFKR